MKELFNSVLIYGRFCVFVKKESPMGLIYIMRLWKFIPSLMKLRIYLPLLTVR